MPGKSSPDSFTGLSLEEQVYQVKTLLQDIVGNYPGGHKGLAHDLGVSYITLSRWCNELLKDYCIPPHMIVNLYQRHPDPRLVQFICQNTNHLAVPVPEPLAGFHEVARALGSSFKEFGDLLHEVGRTLSEKGGGKASITSDEMSRVRKEAHEAMASIATLLKVVEVLPMNNK